MLVKTQKFTSKSATEVTPIKKNPWLAVLKVLASMGLLGKNTLRQFPLLVYSACGKAVLFEADFNSAQVVRL